MDSNLCNPGNLPTEPMVPLSSICQGLSGPVEIETFVTALKFERLAINTPCAS
jgi:hypothetical protein